MATINLGNLAFTHKGNWNSGISYIKNDTVLFTDGKTYACILDNTGLTPDINPSNWELFTIGLTASEKTFIETVAAGTAQTLDPSKKCISLAKINTVGGYDSCAFLMANSTVKTSGASTSNGSSLTKALPTEIKFDTNIVPEKIFQGQRSTYVLDTNKKPSFVGYANEGSGIDTSNKILGSIIPFFVTNNINVVDIITNRGWDLLTNQSVYFITDLGHVYACGYNAYGNLGDGSTTNRLNPVRCGTLTGIIGLSCSNSATTVFAWNAAGQCWAWGAGTSSCRGDNNVSNINTPFLLTTIINVKEVVTTNDFSSVSSNNTSFSIAVKLDGTVWVAGNSSPVGQLGLGAGTASTWTPIPGITNIKNAYVVGGYYGEVILLSNTGSIICWGYNSSGLFGDNTSTSRNTPYTPPLGTGPGQLPIQGSVVEVKLAGIFSQHNMMLRSSTNRVFISGMKNVGQKADGTTTTSNNFIEIKGIRGEIAEMQMYTQTDAIITCAIRYVDGRVEMWGSNASQRSGTSATSASDMTILSPVLF